MVKVYEMSRFDAMTIRVNYLGQTIVANFKGGNRLTTRAKLTTADVFVQDALEHDPRYGKLFVLTQKYENTPEAAVKAAVEREKPKKIVKVKTVNDALLFFTKMGANVTSDSDLNQLMEQYNVEFPNLRR